MKVYNKILAAALSITFAAGFTGGCTTEADSQLGMEFIPENQIMEVRRKTYFDGKVASYGGSTDERCDAFRTTLYMTDSVISSNLGYGYFGMQQSDTFGLRKAGFLTQFTYTDPLDEEGFGYRPIFDSAQLALLVADFAGDTLERQQFEVFELKQNIVKYMDKGESDENYVAYSSFDPSECFDPSRPLFRFTFPDGKSGPSASEVTLQETPYTLDFIRRLMLIEDAPDWDGKADEVAIYQNREKFAEKFHGLCIRPASADVAQGAMFATQLTGTGLMIYGRNRDITDKNLIKDTLVIEYVFSGEADDYSGSEYDNSINYVGHDFASSMMASYDMDERKTAAEHTESRLGFITGMGGPVMEVTLKDELIESIGALGKDEANTAAGEQFSAVSIMQALLYLYLPQSDYDYMAVDSQAIVPFLDAAMPGLGIYTDYKAKERITDYYYSNATSLTSPYDNTLNRSLGCYIINISALVQQIWQLQNSQQDNDAETTKESLDKLRTLYIAPLESALFTMKRSTVQGQVAAQNNAPIKLELTYTLIK